MLFTCVPETGGCERKNLMGFVSLYNSMFGTSYQATKCLDVTNRNDKMPELLLEAPGSQPVAIESKVVAWPKDYCYRHRKRHNFANQFVGFLRAGRDPFNDAPYRLTFPANYLDPLRKEEVKRLAEDVVLQIHDSADSARGKRGVEGSQPVDWHFGPAQPEEWGETTSSCNTWVETVELLPVPSFSEFEAARQVAIRGYAVELDRAIVSSRRKFERFDGHMRILIVYFVGDSSTGISDREFGELVHRAQLPNEIDEVWVAFPLWKDEFEYDFAWKPMRLDAKRSRTILQGRKLIDRPFSARQCLGSVSIGKEQLENPFFVKADGLHSEPKQAVADILDDGAEVLAIEVNGGFRCLTVVRQFFSPMQP